ncbi:MAG: hypothetical protein ACYC9Z_07730 [Casimicrobiaceae bacterium]
MRHIWIACSIFVAGAAYGVDQQALPSTSHGNATPQSALSEDATSKLQNVSRGSSVQTPINMRSTKPDKKTTYTSLYGGVYDDAGNALCALILANGVFMFSCSPYGTYSLSNVPLDSNGQITLFGFADGHYPFQATLFSGGQYNMTIHVAQ